VIEGRDIATVVFPEAILKVFLTATPEVRAQRRVDQDGGDVAQIAAAIAERDLLDSTRADSPLASSSDSVVVDTSDRAIDDVVEEIERLFTERLQ
jgi:cytidylate kinase